MANNRSREDALSTLRYAVLMGMTERAHLTKLQAGPQSQMLLEDVVEAILDPSLRWMFAVLAEEGKTTTEEAIP